MYKLYFKRLLDFLIVLTALLLIWPILLLIIIFLHFANKAEGNLYEDIFLDHQKGVHAGGYC